MNFDLVFGIQQTPEKGDNQKHNRMTHKFRTQFVQKGEH